MKKTNKIVALIISLVMVMGVMSVLGYASWDDTVADFLGSSVTSYKAGYLGGGGFWRHSGVPGDADLSEFCGYNGVNFEGEHCEGAGAYEGTDLNIWTATQIYLNGESHTVNGFAVMDGNSTSSTMTVEKAKKAISIWVSTSDLDHWQKVGINDVQLVNDTGSGVYWVFWFDADYTTTAFVMQFNSNYEGHLSTDFNNVNLGNDYVRGLYDSNSVHPAPSAAVPLPKLVASIVDEQGGDKIDNLYLNAVIIADETRDVGIIFSDTADSCAYGANPLFIRVATEGHGRSSSGFIQRGCYGNAVITAENLGGEEDDSVLALYWKDMPTSYETIYARVFAKNDDGTYEYGDIIEITLLDGASILPLGDPNIPSNVAKVIIISGQSNAVGYSYSGFLDKDYFDEFSAERREKAYSGYPNVLIRYSNNPLDANQGTCSNSEFEPVKIGMGSKIPDPFYYQEAWGEPIGPEVGIAEYLSEKYPDETFYIIKCATSGSNLSWRWNPTRRGDLYDNMIEFVGGVLGGLKAQGMKPEIISFCWMQGESDAQEKYVGYINLFEVFIEKIRLDLAEYMPGNGMSVADGGIMSFWQNLGLPAIDMNAAKQSYADKSSKNFFIETISWSRDIERPDSGTGHFDSYSMIVLGRKFGECVSKALLDYNLPAVLR